MMVDPEHVRQVLWEAVCRGRTPQPRPVVNPVVDRNRSPIAPGLLVQDLELCSEPDSPQGWVPLRLVWKDPAASNVPAENAEDAADEGEHTQSSEQPHELGDGTAGDPSTFAVLTATTETALPSTSKSNEQLPTVIFLHATGASMDAMRQQQEEFARAGYFTAALDCRYHGERVGPLAPGQSGRDVYQDALVRAWREGPEHPFLLDNVWDVLHVVDFLTGRPEVDNGRIGITGISLGGMHSWLAAVLDDRISVAAPVIGVQGFKWAVDHKQFEGRTDSIPKVFAAAAADLGRSKVDDNVVKAVWDKLLPGMLTAYDAPLSLPTVAPRPFLVANGELDPRCPVPGVKEAMAAARAAYLEFYLPPPTPATPEDSHLWNQAHGTTTTSDTPVAADSNSTQPSSEPVGGSAQPIVSSSIKPAQDKGHELTHIPANGAGVHTTASVVHAYGGYDFGQRQPDDAAQLHSGGGTPQEHSEPEHHEPSTEDLITAAASAAKDAAAAAQEAAGAARRSATAARSSAQEALAITTAAAATHAAVTAAETAESQAQIAEEAAQAAAASVAGMGPALAGLAAAQTAQALAAAAVQAAVTEDITRQARASLAADAAAAGLTAAREAAAIATTAAKVEATQALATATAAAKAAASVEAAAVAAAVTVAEAGNLVDETLVLYIEPGVGHKETVGMHRAVRAFFDMHLKRVQRGFLSTTVQRNVQHAH